MKTNKELIKPYFPHLDGLRFFAFLIVFISHAVLFILNGKLYFAQGDMGVSFFFVLSGFLITHIIYFEKETKKSINITNFYARRILRIWPVYFMVLIGSIILSKLNLQNLPYEVGFKPEFLPWYFGFISNFYMIKIGGLSVILAILWSISIEEQFYFVWPLIVSFVKEKFITIILGLIIIGSTIFRLINADNYNIVHYSTFSVLSDLALGCLVGFLTFKIPKSENKIKALFNKKNTLVLYVSLIIATLIKMFPPQWLSASNIYKAILPLIFSSIFILIILEQNYSSNSFFKASKIKSITYLGQISYGLYAYHAIAIAVIFSIFSTLNIKNGILISIISFVFTILVSHLSYKYIEKKILFFKKWVQ